MNLSGDSWEEEGISSCFESEEVRAAMATLIQAANNGQGGVSPEMAQQLNTILGQMNASQPGASNSNASVGGGGTGTTGSST